MLPTAYAPKVSTGLNPNLGISVGLDFYEGEFEKAKNQPSFENEFKRLYLNMQTQQDKRWLSISDWDKGNKPFNVEDLYGKECYGGLDMSSTTDLTSFTLFFPSPMKKDEHYVVSYNFLPNDNLRKKELQDKIQYSLFKDKGYLITTEGNIVDEGFVENKVLECSKLFNIRSIGYDSWQANAISSKLFNVWGLPMCSVSQGYAVMNGACRNLESMVVSGNLVHGGNPLLRWMAGNVAIQSDNNNNIRPVKAKSTGRIDGIVALLMGIARWDGSQNQEQTANHSIMLQYGF